jgi:S1-C subfamily serine protease
VVQITEPVDSPFVPAVLGSTAELRTGETAIAIGSPLRLLGGPTVTVGVISAVDRRLQSPGGDWLYDLVQTDAPISPGSSGGALVDANGALVGITTVIAVSNVGAEGLGFATPVEIAYEVATDIMTWGAARHGLLGLRGEDAEDDELAATGRPTGVIVREVDPTGPAGQAGVQVGDIILSLDSEPVDGMSDLVVDARFLDPGSNATLELYRDGEYLAVTVVVGELR